MADNATLEIFPNERFGSIGQTGSGKTFVMLRIINGLRYENEDLDIIIVDTKRNISVPNFVRTSKFEAVFGSSHVIYRPPNNRPSNSFYERIWNKYAGNRKRDMLLYIDEAAHITGPSSIPDGLRLLIQGGRDQGIGVWYAGQEPTNISNALISQAEKMLVFLVPVASQRAKLVGRWGDSADAAGDLPEHHFLGYGFKETDPIKAGAEIAAVVMMADTEKVGA